MTENIPLTTPGVLVTGCQVANGPIIEDASKTKLVAAKVQLTIVVLDETEIEREGGDGGLVGCPLTAT